MKYVKIYEKLGIYSVEDLLNHFPYRYDEIEVLTNQFTSLTQKKVIVKGLISSKSPIMRGKIKFFKFGLETEFLSTTVYVFNRNFLRNNIIVGNEVCVVGKYDPAKNTLSCEEVLFNNYEHLETLLPVYNLTEGLSLKVVRNNIKQAFTQYNELIKENLPLNLVEKYKLCTKLEMYQKMHFSKQIMDYEYAKRRAKYEELLLFMLKINVLKQDNNKVDHIFKKDFDNLEIENYIANLPFILTDEQMKVINEIIVDMKKPTKMNRLVQGDVGSGKTVVASCAILMNYLAGYQSCFMAPTEILATQHYQSLVSHFKDYELRIELLTGSTKNKSELYHRLQNNKIDVIIGTHALFQERVQYANLGVVITDEQHRFGVKQREMLNSKSDFIDVLTLSATPIPRTLALTAFSDLSISELKTLPNGRKEIKTSLLSEQQITDALTEIYQTVKRGEQVYVVAPLIDESENFDSIDVNTLYEKLGVAFKRSVRIEKLYGSLPPEEKNQIMTRFNNKEVDLLVSTTVIEVGVNNPNATLIVIFDAYRFGLAQLHQLRGRVGRSDKASKCLLISSKETERLQIMTQTNDGFKLSEEDLRLRGPGDFFGKQQSGILSFNVANLVTDVNILKCAISDSEELINKDDFNCNKEYEYLRDIVRDVKKQGLN